MAQTALAAYKSGQKAASRKGRSHRRAKTSVSLATVAGFVPLGVYALQDYKTGGLASLGDGLSRRLTGFGTAGSGGFFEPKYLFQGLIPILGGALVHKLANRLGINRQLRNATMGYLSI